MDVKDKLLASTNASDMKILNLSTRILETFGAVPAKSVGFSSLQHVRGTGGGVGLCCSIPPALVLGLVDAPGQKAPEDPRGLFQLSSAAFGPPGQQNRPRNAGDSQP